MKPDTPNTMTCKSVQEQIYPLYENTLPESMINAMSIHLNSCEACRTINIQFKMTLEEIQHDRQIPDDPFFITRLLARQGQEISILQSPITSLLFPKFKPAFLSFSLLVGLFAGILIGKITHQELSGISPDKTSRSEAMKVYAEETLVSDITAVETDNLLIIK